MDKIRQEHRSITGEKICEKNAPAKGGLLKIWLLALGVL
jgi:hypothetical protein